MKTFLLLVSLLLSSSIRAEESLPKASAEAASDSSTAAAPAASEEEIKKWFADVLWQRFVAERDPRLAGSAVTYDELNEFMDNAERGHDISLSFTELKALVQYRDKMCEAKGPPMLDLDKGVQLR